MQFDWLIVGAGFTGATLAERIASRLDQKVLVVDRRDHIGGNAYDGYDEHGILVHHYGPHIFHTNSKRIWDYLSRFTAWRPYDHRVLALIDGQKLPLPFNLNTLAALFPPATAGRLEEELIAHVGFGGKVPILKLRETSSRELKLLADLVYEKVFYGYNLKQWGLAPEELDPSVSGRVPVVVSRDDRYFHDTYQAMPARGYTELIRNMLRHPNIKVMLNTDYREIGAELRYERLAYTGPIDEYFDYAHGPLPYRSLDFDFQNHAEAPYQEVATVNYPSEHDFTRITEFRHLTGQRAPSTTVVAEYPRAHEPGETIPYYPVPRPESRERYARYAKEAERLSGRVLFAGRLADYKYYNMDQAVGRALQLASKLLGA